MEALNKLASKITGGKKDKSAPEQERAEAEGAFDATGVHDDAPAALRSSAWRALVEGAPAWPGVREFEAPAGSRSLPWHDLANALGARRRSTSVADEGAGVWRCWE